MELRIMELPIPVSDLFEIQRILKNNNIIYSVFEPHLFNVYDFKDYIREEEIHGTEINILFDLNIFTNLISLIRGKKQLLLPIH